VPMDKDPLQAVAEKAKEDWTVKWAGEKTLWLSDWWPLASVAALGYYQTRARLRYEDAKLEVAFFVQANSACTLFLPCYYDAESGAGLPDPRDQLVQIMDWAGVPRGGWQTKSGAVP
jgi:hypothetical protein